MKCDPPGLGKVREERRVIPLERPSVIVPYFCQPLVRLKMWTACMVVHRALGEAEFSGVEAGCGPPSKKTDESGLCPPVSPEPIKHGKFSSILLRRHGRPADAELSSISQAGLRSILPGRGSRNHRQGVRAMPGLCWPRLSESISLHFPRRLRQRAVPGRYNGRHGLSRGGKCPPTVAIPARCRLRQRHLAPAGSFRKNTPALFGQPKIAGTSRRTAGQTGPEPRPPRPADLRSIVVSRFFFPSSIDAVRKPSSTRT